MCVRVLFGLWESCSFFCCWSSDWDGKSGLGLRDKSYVSRRAFNMFFIRNLKYSAVSKYCNNKKTFPGSNHKVICIHLMHGNKEELQEFPYLKFHTCVCYINKGWCSSWLTLQAIKNPIYFNTPLHLHSIDLLRGKDWSYMKGTIGKVTMRFLFGFFFWNSF